MARAIEEADPVEAGQGDRAQGEIEVEAMPQQNGTAGGIIDPLVLRLRGAGAGAPDPTPKHIRALGPRAMEQPEVAAQPVQADSPATDVIKHVFAESIASLLKHDPLIRTSGDPEAVHQARVATRKLRSHLRTFGPLLDPEWTESLRPELGWLALGLGAVRDREVLLERLRERAKSLPDSDQRSAGALLQILETEIKTLRAKLMEELSSLRYVDLLERRQHAGLLKTWHREEFGLRRSHLFVEQFHDGHETRDPTLGWCGYPGLGLVAQIVAGFGPGRLRSRLHLKLRKVIA